MKTGLEYLPEHKRVEHRGIGDITGYKGKSHNIKELYERASGMNREFARIFPLDTKENSDRFTLLVKAYIDSRYKKNYTITKEDLEYLGPRVEALRELVKKVCEGKFGE